MTVTAVRKDPQALTMTLEAEFDTSAERVCSCGQIRASSSAGGPANLSGDLHRA
jgi:hypothetical protein